MIIIIIIILVTGSGYRGHYNTLSTINIIIHIIILIITIITIIIIMILVTGSGLAGSSIKDPRSRSLRAFTRYSNTYIYIYIYIVDIVCYLFIIVYYTRLCLQYVIVLCITFLLLFQRSPAAASVHYTLHTTYNTSWHERYGVQLHIRIGICQTVQCRADSQASAE